MTLDVVEEELVDSVQRATADAGEWQGSNAVSDKPAIVNREDILREQPHLSSQHIGQYSKFKWISRQVRTSGVQKREYQSEQICVRPVGVIVLETNSPFVVPNSRKDDADVIRSVDALNERYMFVVEEANPMVLAQIEASIKTMCVCHVPVSVEAFAYLMLGMEGTVEDTVVLSKLLQEVNFKRLEWKMVPTPEPSINVPSVAGLLSPKGCTSVQLYAPVVLQHITVHDSSLYDIELHGKHLDVNETSIGPSPAESSSGWEGVVSSDASSRRWFGSAMVGPRLDRMRGMTSSSDTNDTQISIPSRAPPPVVEELGMHEKLRKMMPPRMYRAVCFLQIPQKSWFVALYFVVASTTIAMLRYALTDFRGVPDGKADGGYLLFANFGATLFSYVYIWITFPSATDVWYNLYNALSEDRRISISTKWEKRCTIAIVYGMVISMLGCLAQTKHIIGDHSDMVSNLPVFCVVTGVMWLLNTVQTCLISYGVTAYMFTCRLSKYDISESKFTLRNFAQFLARCAKMHKFRIITFGIIFITVCVEIAMVLHAFLRTVHVKYFIFVPFGVILPHLSNSTPILTNLWWTLLMTLPYVVMFIRMLYASLWAAKAKAVRQTQLTGELKEKFIASPNIAGWCLFHRLVR